MSVINRIKAIHLARTQLLELIPDQLAVINELRIRKARSRLIRVSGEATNFRLKRPSLPRIIRCRRRDDHSSTAAREVLGGGDEVGRVGQDILLDVGVAGLVAGARAVRSAVVGRCERAAVVVAELNDDEVFGLNEGGDFGEVAFDGVAAGGTAGDCFVDYWDGQGVFEVLTPACRMSLVWCAVDPRPEHTLGSCATATQRHGGVTGEVDCRRSRTLSN